jgi:EAL domain-containing protein (putative c-di-GMP-specific phosphodiesterase class I)
MDILISRYNPLHLNLPKIFILALRDLLVQVFWFFGIHGEHMVNALFGKDILFEHICPNFTYGEFHRLFVNIGGAGIGFSLLIALLINAKDKTLKTLAKISAPFVLFNINDIIIFLIVVFNRFLIMPFLLLPLLNLTLGYMFVNIVHINYTDYYVVWSTPVFVDGFLKTDSFAIPLFQLFLIILDTAVYSFFLKKYFQIQSIENKKQILQENLEINEELKAKKDIKPFLANREMIEANAKLNGLITDLNQDNLLIYYQPKADIRHNKAVKYEALLRYNDNGHIRGPFFLDLIEKAGLAPIIDIWVCKQVKKDIQKFNRQNFFPQISVNLHPDTLTSTDAVNIILNIFENENIMFEIIERSFVNEEAQNNLKKIKAKNFPVSIDDFGVGYSSLETLVKYNIDELKLDKSLIDEIENPKGYLVCKNTIQLCKDLKIKAVAEGVETASQLEIVKNLDVDFVQGYVFSPAIPFEKVKTFSDSFNLTDL